MTRPGAVGIAVAAILSAGFAGCDDDEKTTADTAGDIGANRGSATGGSPGVGVGDRDSDVGIRDFEFVPDLAPIPAGASVEWTNSGDVAHTVTWRSGAGARFDSGPIEPGESYKRGFPADGLIRYRCTIHPRMTGQVRVYR